MNGASLMKLSRVVQSAAASGVLTLGLLAASASPASAYTRTKCDSDGDYCWRVSCTYYDDCHPIDGSGYYRNDYYRRYHRYSGGYGGYYGGYHSGYDRYHSDRRYVCDRDGDDCHWSYTRRDYDDYDD